MTQNTATTTMQLAATTVHAKEFTVTGAPDLQSDPDTYFRPDSLRVRWDSSTSDPVWKVRKVVVSGRMIRATGELGTIRKRKNMPVPPSSTAHTELPENLPLWVRDTIHAYWPTKS